MVPDNETHDPQEPEEHNMPPNDPPLVVNEENPSAIDIAHPIQPLQDMPPEVNAALRPLP